MFAKNHQKAYMGMGMNKKPQLGRKVTNQPKNQYTTLTVTYKSKNMISWSDLG